MTQVTTTPVRDKARIADRTLRKVPWGRQPAINGVALRIVVNHLHSVTWSYPNQVHNGFWRGPREGYRKQVTRTQCGVFKIVFANAGHLPTGRRAGSTHIRG
jgi:hypothetical protein